MKANEAPEKLYVDVRDSLSDSILYGFTEKRKEDDIEYIRKDAFIDKAADWLFYQANYYTKLKIDAHNSGVYADFYADKMVDDFKKAMKL